MASEPDEGKPRKSKVPKRARAKSGHEKRVVDGLRLVSLLKSGWSNVLALNVGALLLLYGVIQYWPQLAYLIQGETTGSIFIDSPEVYTRERLVNDRYIQDAWLRKKLTDVDSTLSPIQFSKIEQAIGGITDKGINVEEAQKALGDISIPPTMIGPGTQFKLHNAIRELIRQEIVENQLDDRHDLLGNTMYMLKFDAAVIPGERTSKNALIRVKINLSEQSRNPTQLDVISEHYVHAKANPGIPDPSPTYKIFEKWVESLEQRVSARSRAIYSELTNSEPRELVLENFLYFVVSFQRQLEIGRDPKCGDLVSGKASRRFEYVRVENKPPTDVLKCYLSSEYGLKLLRPYLSVFSVRTAIESEVGARVLSNVSVIKLSEELWANQLFSFDGPFSLKVQVAQDENLRSAPGVSLRSSIPQLIVTNSECYDTFLDPAKSDVLKRNEIREGIFDVVLNVDGDGSALNKPGDERRFIMGVERSLQVLLNGRFEKPEIASALADKIEILNEVLQVSVRGESLEKPENIKLFSLYLKRALASPSYPVIRLTERAIDEANRDIDDYLKSAEKRKCGLIAVSAPVSYFDFIGKLVNAAPFSYAVLPKFDADVEAIESGSYSEILLSNLISKTPDEIRESKDFKAQIARLSALRQAFPRTTLIGFGFQEPVGASGVAENTWKTGRPNPMPGPQGVYNSVPVDKARLDELPAFGWVIAPDRNIESEFFKGFRFQPVQKSLSALISVPSWWTNIDVNVETNWLKSDGTLEYPNCEYPGETVVPRCPVYKIALPTDMQSLDELVVRKVSRGPVIDVFDVPKELNTRQCREANIAIPGNRLWRSTTVTLDGQEANRIVVMPNMRGIIAEFDLVRTSEKEPPLIVWTSTGLVRYPGKLINTGDDSCLRAKSKAQSDSSTGR